MNDKIRGFETKYGMINDFGCIDGTHIPKKNPVKDPADFFCYKQYFSLNVQAVCDSNGHFLDVDVNWPGSVHDAKVFGNSKFNTKLKTKVIPEILKGVLPGHPTISSYVIGDPAYPLTSRCMNELTNCSNNQEVIFNQMLRSARNPIECALGMVEGIDEKD